MQDRELRASLTAIGALLPVLVYAGDRIDGRKRAQMCAELGIPIETRQLDSLQQACSALWPHHPRRALSLAGPRPLVELAQLCGTTSAAVAREMHSSKRKTPPGEHERRRRTVGHAQMRTLRSEKRMVQVLIRMEPELREYGKELARQKGHKNLSKCIRAALWKEVALLPQAPLHQPRRVQPPNGTRRKTG